MNIRQLNLLVHQLQMKHLQRPKYIPVVSRTAKVIKPIPVEIVQSTERKNEIIFCSLSLHVKSIDYNVHLLLYL